MKPRANSQFAAPPASPGAAEHTLREQLTPLVGRLPKRHAHVEPVSQVLLRLLPVTGEDRFVAGVKTVLAWMNERVGRGLPDAAWDIESFELTDVGAQPVTAIAMQEPRLWAARFDDADKKVPLRTWIAETCLMAEKDEVLIGARLTCAARGEHPTYRRTVPAFVRRVMSSGPFSIDGVADGWVKPLVVDTEGAVDDLISLLERPTRRLPVVVFALPDGSERPSEAMLDVARFLSDVCAAAHVRILTAKASYELTDRAGKEMSVFRQAVRLYRPGFNRWRDSPQRHPLFLPERIRRWEGGVYGFSEYLIDWVLARTVATPDRDEVVPSFGEIRQRIADAERKKLRDQGGSQKDLLKLYEQENEQLRSDFDSSFEEYCSGLASLQAKLDLTQQQADELRSEAFVLRKRIGVLQARLDQATTNVVGAFLPDHLDGFDKWCDENLAGFVTLHSRVRRGAQKSKFAQPKRIYEALLLLRDYYVPMRREPGGERKAAFERACRELQLEDSLVGAATKQYPNLYTIDYDGRPRVLDRHLKYGVAHDDSRSLRVYYFWDEETETVVVGWLPSHLDNSMT